jgi:hypothetical protein
LNDEIGVATTATQLHGRVWPHASAEILDDLSIIRLDYPLDIVDTP